MTRPIPQKIDPYKAASCKPQATSNINLFKSWQLVINTAVSFLLSAKSFLSTSFGTRIGLLWRRSVQILFSMASSLLGGFQTFFVGRSKVRVVICSFLFAICICNSVQAQRPTNIDSAINATDSANVYYDDSTTSIEDIKVDTSKTDDKKIIAAIVLLSEDSIKSLRLSKGFAYMGYIDSLLKAKELAKKKKPIKEQPQEETGTSFWENGFVKTLCWAVAIGLVLFVLFRLFSGKGSAFASNAKNNIPQVDLEEELEPNDINSQLKKAIQSGNYRLATRYLFLQTLQQLADKKVISLSTEKTNIQYSQELREKPYADSFARLCLLYEYVWFGEFNINTEQFTSIQQQQQQLIKAI